MKYAIKYYKGGEDNLLTKADEIIIKYTHKTTEIIDFVQKWRPEQRVIINVCEYTGREPLEDCLDIFAAAAAAHPNIALTMNFKKDDVINQRCKETRIPFFYSDLVYSPDVLTLFINSGASDVYIANEYGFSLKDISTQCKYKGVNIRIYPNVAQSSAGYYENSFSCFFVRPEDIELYSDYVDVCEFYGPLDKQSVLYNVYNDKHWSGDLKDIIIGLEYSIDSRTITPYFGNARLRCNKMCTYGKCQICKNTQKLAKTLEEKGLGLRKARDYEHKTNENTMSDESGATQGDSE